MLENMQEIKWQDYLRIFCGASGSFMPLSIVFTIMVIASFLLPKSYEAKAIILVEEGKVLNPLLKNLAISTTVSERLHLLREEILSWPRVVQLVEELGLNKNKTTPLQFEKLIADIRMRISVSMKGVVMITISYHDRNPAITQKVVNTISDIFIRKNLISQSEESNTAIDFIKDQLDIYKKKLETSEGALRSFKETYGLQMPLAAQINTELARLEAELTTLLVDCTEEHPKVKELRANMKSLKEKRTQQIRLAAESANVDAKEYIEIAESIPKQEQELARLTRDTAVNEELYAMLLERLETARISEELEDSENKTKFKIIEPARFPLKPTKPDKAKFGLMGLVLGAMAGFGCIYLVEYSDQSFRGVEELKSFIDIPVLGAISKITTEEHLHKPSLLANARGVGVFSAKKETAAPVK